MIMITETITVHRNGCLRQWKYDFGTGQLHDLATGEVSKTDPDVLKSDLKRQGFRFLSYDPDDIVMTPKERQQFRDTFGY